MQIDFTAPLWHWDARPEEGWMFVSLPQDASDQLRDYAQTLPPRGFGSLRVSVLVGTSTWRTSIFPGAADAPYALPIKNAVRVREGLSEGDPVTVRLDVLDG